MDPDSPRLRLSILAVVVLSLFCALFARLCDDEPYRRAVVAADLAIADSGLMVVMWRLLQHERIRRGEERHAVSFAYRKLQCGRLSAPEK